VRSIISTIKNKTRPLISRTRQNDNQHTKIHFNQVQRPTSAPARHQQGEGDNESSQADSAPRHRVFDPHFFEKFTPGETDNFDEWNDENSVLDESESASVSQRRDVRVAPLPKNFILSNPPQNKRQSHRSEILADKYHWKKIHLKENNNALSSLASMRAQQYLHTTPQSSYSSRTSPTEANGFEDQRKKIIPKDSKILSSGSSSLEIANAFLQTTLGQDLVDNYRSDYQQHQSPGGENHEHQQNQQRNQKSVNTRSEDQDFYRAYYSQDWKSRKGGWVGDFSSPHTHPLSVRHADEDGKRTARY
jgi:hypothetical protein